jgi:hypothetical protein
LEFDRVIIAEPGQQQSPREGTWLEFDRVIIADRASMVHNHGSMGQHDAQPWIPGPAVCTTMDPRASSLHNHGSMGQQSAHVGKPWVNVCTRRQTLGERLQTMGERLHTSANIG